MDEAERLKKIADIQAAAPPGIDVASLAAGTLAGPASPDRPPVPVWNYLDYFADYPDVSLDTIVRIRFPIVSYGGVYTVMSIAELVGKGPGGTRSVGPKDVVRFYQLMHEAGGLSWNPQSRTHEELKDPSEYMKSVGVIWRAELQAKD